MNIVFAFSLVPWPRLAELVRVSSLTLCLPADGDLQNTYLRGLRFLPPRTLKTLAITNFPVDNRPAVADPCLLETLCSVHSLHLHVTFFNGGRSYGPVRPRAYVAFWNKNDLFVNVPNVRTLSIRSDGPVLARMTSFQGAWKFPRLESLYLKGFLLGNQQSAQSFILSHAETLSNLKLINCPILRQNGYDPSDAET